MRHLPIVLTVLAVTAASNAPAAAAQQPAQAAPPSAAAKAGETNLESNWVTQCESKTRQGALECSVRQSVVKTDTRQLVAMFAVRIPAETRAPVMMIQLPLGLFLPGGVELQVDDNKVVALPLQTCEASGCYVGAPVAAELAEQLRRGKLLRIGFKNLAETKIDVPMPLAGFASAYDSIK